MTGIAVNLLSLAVLLGSVSWIARALYSCPQAVGYGDSSSDSNGLALNRLSTNRLSTTIMGALAALLAACYHFNAWLIHDAFLDYPLTVMVTVTFAALIRAGDFRVRRYALMFGLAAGLGLLTKQSFAFFFVLPSLYVVIKVLRTRDRKALINLALAALVAMAIAAIWYAPHLDDVIAIYRMNKEAAVSENEAPLFSLGSNLFYIHALLSAQMQVPLAILFVGGTIYSIIRYRSESVLLYLWLLSGIALFTFIANKDVRYTVPVLPAAAVLSVSWLGNRKRKESNSIGDSPEDTSLRQERFDKAVMILKTSLVSAAVIWALVSFFNAQWPQPGTGYYVDTPRFRWMVFGRNYYGYDHQPLGDDWSVPDIVRAVVRDKAETNPQAPVLGVVVNLPFLNPSTISLYARLLSPERAGPPVLKVDWVVVESARDRLQSCEYILVRTGLEYAEWVAPMEKQVEEFIIKNPDRFTKVAAFPVPLDRAEAVIYRCVGAQ